MDGLSNGNVERDEESHLISSSRFTSMFWCPCLTKSFSLFPPISWEHARLYSMNRTAIVAQESHHDSKSPKNTCSNTVCITIVNLVRAAYETYVGLTKSTIAIRPSPLRKKFFKITFFFSLHSKSLESLNSLSLLFHSLYSTVPLVKASAQPTTRQWCNIYPPARKLSSMIEIAI